MTGLHRRSVLHLALCAAALPALARFARAEAYPSRPVQIILGFPAGGSSDVIGRMMAQWLSQRLDRPFVFENRAGAGSNIGTQFAAKAAPDGYTLLWATSANAFNATLYDNLSFDFVHDFAPVAAVFRVPNVVVVHPFVPANTLPELIAYAKANPGTLNMASGGNGSALHVFGELFQTMTGTHMTHVPYRGSAVALIDLLSGRVQVMFNLMSSSIEPIKAGKLRALAVTTATRSELLPDVPTVGEFVPGYEASTWNGVVAPKNTPAEIIGKLAAAINAGLSDRQLTARIAALGASVLIGSPAEFGKLIVDDTEKWGKVIREHNIRAQ